MLVNLIRMDMKKNRWDYLVLFLHSTIIFSLCNAFSSLQRGNYLLRFCNSQDFLSGFYFFIPQISVVFDGYFADCRGISGFAAAAA